MDSKFKKIILLFFILNLGMPYIATAHDNDGNGNGNGNGNGKCKSHVMKMAGLVKDYHEVTAAIETANSELEALKQSENSLTDEEKLKITELENIIKNKIKDQKNYLTALNSKSKRVIEHCSE